MNFILFMLIIFLAIKVSPLDKQKIDILHAVEVCTNKIFAVMAKKIGAHWNVGCLEKDIQNHIDKERQFDIRRWRCQRDAWVFYAWERRKSLIYYYFFENGPTWWTS